MGRNQYILTGAIFHNSAHYILSQVFFEVNENLILFGGVKIGALHVKNGTVCQDVVCLKTNIHCLHSVGLQDICC